MVTKFPQDLKILAKMVDKLLDMRGLGNQPKKMNKRKTTIYKNKDRVTRTPLKPGVDSAAYETWLTKCWVSEKR